MAEWEQLSALMTWMQRFDIGGNRALSAPEDLIDGYFFAAVHNQVADTQIPIDTLKKVSGPDDWVNILLNLRQISSRIADVLRQNHVDFNVNMRSIAQKQDRNELLKFAKFFLFFAMRSEHRDRAIAVIRGMDQSVQYHLQSILQEMTPAASAPEQKEDSGENADNNRLVDKLKELKTLRAQSAELNTRIQQAKEASAEAQRSSSNRLHEKIEKLTSDQDLLKNECQQLEVELMNTDHSINEAEERILSIQSQLASTDTTTVDPAEIRSLEEKLAVLKQRELDMSAMAGLKEEQAHILSAIKALEKSVSSKRAELKALDQALAGQRRSVGGALHAQLKDLQQRFQDTPLGKMQKEVQKYRRVAQKLTEEIADVGASSITYEAAYLQKEVQDLATKKAADGALLVKKLEYIQTLRRQSAVRLQRIKTQCAIYMHSERMKAWQRSFQ